MIYDSLKHNEEVTPNSLELNTLRENFPQYFDKDGQFMLGRFSEMLRINEMQITKEGYELSLIHISEPTRLHKVSRMPSSA